MKLEILLQALSVEITPKERALIEKAHGLAEQAHAGQFRSSGDPYVQHCLQVAYILAELRMPAVVIAAGLLHDTVEDTALKTPELEREFGTEVAKLVEGVTKLAQLPRVSKDGTTPIDQHKESLRKTFLAMGDDVRVVLIKLADRLHNMRTLQYVKPEKQARIARETLEIYAPLANRLGIWQMKWELEDLSFRHLQPEKYREIAAQIDELRVDRERTMERIVRHVHEALTKEGLESDISGRPKHIYSIYKKMERKQVGFHEVFDVRAVRVIVKDKTACYQALGVIHNLWKPIPGQFDDYIASPKDNFYQSLHTAVVYDDGKDLEVQIRTSEMHENAEYGIAAHWRYKEGARREEAFEKRIQWLRGLMEWRNDLSAGEFVEAVRDEVHDDRVYIFTPRGDILDLPMGSTPIDFAYHVHTTVGDRCRGAKVNGKLVSLDYRLKTGDKVEILTAKQGGPSRDWLNPALDLVKSHRAQQKIRQWFRKQDREQIVNQGREILDKTLKQLGADEFNLEKLAHALSLGKVEELLYAIGTGDVHQQHIAAKVMADEQEQHQKKEKELPSVAPKDVRSNEVSILGAQGFLTKLAPCCRPVPGDPIIGYITRGRGVTVHRRDCPNVLENREPERYIRVSWGQAQNTYPVLVRIIAYDRDGLARDVTTLVSEEHINMTAFNATTKNSIATIEATMEIADVGLLSRVLARIETLPNVIEARRWRAG